MSTISSQLNSIIDPGLEREQIASNSQKPDIFENSITHEERLGYKVIEYPTKISINPLINAVTRVNDFWEQIKGYSNSKEHITNNDAITKLVRGTCRGSVEALLDQCAKGLSIEEAAQAVSLDKEGVYFRHLAASINLLDLMEIKYKEKKENYQSIIDNAEKIITLLDELTAKIRSEIEEETDDTEIAKKRLNLINMLTEIQNTILKLQIYEQKLKTSTSKLNGTKKVIEKLKKDGLLYYKSNSIEREEKCKCFDSLPEYEKTLDKLLSNIPSATTARGIIELPKHTMGFEYGPKGFYLFDTAVEAGLYRFQDRATFVKALQSFVHTAASDMLEDTSIEECCRAEVQLTVTSLVPS